MPSSNNNPKSANFCLDIVKKFAIGSIMWEEFRVHDGLISSTLMCTDIRQTRLKENGGSVNVVTLRNGFFLYMDMAFEHNKKRSLQAISLHFYDETDLMLRADWSYQEYNRGTHAQPHWHMGPRVLRNDVQQDVVRTFADFGGNFNTFQAESENVSMGIDTSRMHLFMAYDGNDGDFLDFQNEDLLKKWLSHTLKYMDVQLRSLKSHKWNSE